ncbi:MULTISPECIES: hypothetical protein [unclassified Streptomyces]|uniref:hypothetical protein n=1 Tax=unclassified Streptomyces TaxID=2593676 RepID=UPI00365C604B
MNEAWAAVVAAVAAGVFALAGGYYGSRRQTTDQADVEHGQWQRGQRQEAYLALLDAWDAAVRRLTDLAGDWEHQLYGEAEQRAGAEFSDVIAARTGRITADLKRPMERVHLLGPPTVEDAVAGLRTAIEPVAEHLVRMAVKEDRAAPEDWEPWDSLLEQAESARAVLAAEAKAAQRVSPRPGK